MVKLEVVSTWHQDWMPTKCMGIYRQYKWSSINVHRRNFSTVFIVLEDVWLQTSATVWMRSLLFWMLCSVDCQLLMFRGNQSDPSRVKQFKKKDYLPLEDGARCSEMSVVIHQSMLCIITRAKILRWLFSLQKPSTPWPWQKRHSNPSRWWLTIYHLWWYNNPEGLNLVYLIWVSKSWKNIFMTDVRLQNFS